MWAAPPNPGQYLFKVDMFASCGEPVANFVLRVYVGGELKLTQAGRLLGSDADNGVVGDPAADKGTRAASSALAVANYTFSYSNQQRKAVFMIERLSRVALLGSAWVLYLLFGLSVFSIGIMIERWIFFRVRKDNTDKLGDDLIALLRDGDLRGADHLLAKSPSIEAAVVRDSLKWIDGGPDALSEALEAEMRKKRRELRARHDPPGHHWATTRPSSGSWVPSSASSSLPPAGRGAEQGGHGQRDERASPRRWWPPPSASSSRFRRSLPTT